MALCTIWNSQGLNFINIATGENYSKEVSTSTYLEDHSL